MPLTQIRTSNLDTTNSLFFRNRIINGSMVIDQRNAGASVNVTTELYTLDRWFFANTVSGKLTCQQNAGSVTPPSGFKNYLGVTSASAYSVLTGDLFALKQHIEGFNTADLGFGAAGASTVTLSFWVRSSLTGTFGASLVNNAFDRSYVFTYTINSANTWEYKTITIAGDTSGTWVGATNGIGFRIYFNLGAGSTYSGGTSNTWNAGGYAGSSGTTSVVGRSGATFYITGVQLEKGTAATAFDYRPYGTELALCQRYFYMMAKGNQINFAASNYWGTTELDAYISHKVSMRTAATVYQVTGTNYFNVDRSGNDTFDGFGGIIRGNENGGMMYATSNVSGTDGFAAQIETYNANAVIAFQAEL